jgi:hypothetical protein
MLAMAIGFLVRAEGPKAVSNGEMTGSSENRDAAQHQQRRRSSYAPVQTVTREVSAHEQTPGSPQSNLPPPR